MGCSSNRKIRITFGAGALKRIFTLAVRYPLTLNRFNPIPAGRPLVHRSRFASGIAS
jgi:hypothetical protein